MKKSISVFMVALLLACLVPATALAQSDSSNTRAVIGADLTQEQVANVYQTFGVARGSVPELTMTNERERQELSGLVDSSVIGTKSISCVLVSLPSDGSGLNVMTSDNITWCTPLMYTSALATAGITDATIIVSAPFPVSGTAALSGVFWAYEDITGTPLDSTAKLVATQELTLTGNLAEELGNMDASSIINDLKMMLEETKTMTDSEIRSEILQIAEQYHVTLTDSQISELISLCRSMEGLDDEALLKRVEQAQSALKKVSEAKTAVTAVSDTVDHVVSSVKSFFERIGRIIGYYG